MLAHVEGDSNEARHERYDNDKTDSAQREGIVDCSRPIPDSGEGAGNMFRAGVAEVAEEMLRLCGERRMPATHRAVRQAEQRVKNSNSDNGPEHDRCCNMRLYAAG